MNVTKGQIVTVKNKRNYVAIESVENADFVPCKKITGHAMEKTGERVELTETVFNVRKENVKSIGEPVDCISRKIGLLPKLSDDEIEALESEDSKPEEPEEVKN